MLSGSGVTGTRAGHCCVVGLVALPEGASSDGTRRNPAGTRVPASTGLDRDDESHARSAVKAGVTRSHLPASFTRKGSQSGGMGSDGLWVVLRAVIRPSALEVVGFQRAEHVGRGLPAWSRVGLGRSIFGGIAELLRRFPLGGDQCWVAGGRAGLDDRVGATTAGMRMAAISPRAPMAASTSRASP